MNLFDVAAIVILLLAAAWGARKGLIMAVGKFVTWFGCTFGAWILAFCLKTPIANLFFTPWIRSLLTSNSKSGFNPVKEFMDQASALGTQAEQLLRETLSQYGIPSFSVGQNFGKLLDEMTGTGTSILDATAQILAERLAFTLLFILSFLLIQLLCYLFFHTLEGLNKLPLLTTVNHLGGAFAGILLGLLITGLLLSIILIFYPASQLPGHSLSETATPPSNLFPLFQTLMTQILP